MLRPATPPPARPAAPRAARLDQILEAAARVFAEKSYRRAQMADVARELGVSAGTLYNYVEGKEALFHLLIERGFGREPATPPALPVPTPAAGATLALLRQRLAEDAALPPLETALSRRAPRSPALARRELEAVLRALYDTIERHRVGIRLLERSAQDWPELAQAFFVEMRRRLLGRLARLLETRVASGALAPVPDPRAAARFANEAIAWFAMHRHGDPDADDLDDDTARETAIQLVLRALAKEKESR